MKIKHIAISIIIAITSVSTHAAELIVNWADNESVHSTDVIEQIAEQTGLTITLLKPLQKTFDLVHVAGDSETAINTLQNTGYFKYVEENGIVVSPKINRKLINVNHFNPQKVKSGTVGTLSLVIDKFNDPLYLGQEYLDEQEDSRMGLSSLAKARDYTVKHVKLDRKVRVAVLDTGKWEHEDITWSDDEANFVVGGDGVGSDGYWEMGCSTVDLENTGLDVTCSVENLIPLYESNDSTDKSWWDRDGDGVYTVAIDGHGLSVASQIAATSNNNLGMVGVVPDNLLEIVPVRVLGSFGGDGYSIGDGIWWAIKKYSNGSLQEGDKGYVRPISEPVDVINLSLGGKSALSCEANSYTKDAITEAYKMNISVVIAAGNESADTTYVTPANCEEAFGVASSKMSGEISRFSNYGQFADIAVHGEEITGATMSTIYYGTSRNCGDSNSYNDCYAENSGTSMSAPNASGVLALLKLAYPDLSAKEREAMILNTAVPHELNGNGQASRASKVGYGAGVINAYNALKNDALAIDKVNVQHRYAAFTSPVQEAYLVRMIEVVPTACSMYNIQFGTLQHTVDGVSYNILQTSSTGDINSVAFDKTVVADVPRVTVDASAYTRVAVQSCKDGSCGDIVEVDFSSSVPPAICEG
ncbi:S8 family serine peptidase [Shewanella sp. KX20019]|uniref:S8 family peptidase n=1 Tax=Shewanella sp. KX20019 TaxID=2803864 RepID=UPI001925F79D|nr:S8 family serine peptidase [Shewanella sp. KX20019]QQX80731.1 S8 family serine peptidase [Shewanella sp. KX20019]